MICKSYQVVAVLNNVSMSNSKMTNRHLLSIVSIALLVQCLLLVFYSMVPLTRADYRDGTGATANHLIAVCSPLKVNALLFTVWLGIQLCYIGLFAVYGVYVAVCIRHVPTAFNESTHISNTLFSLVFTLCVLVPLDWLISNDVDALMLTRSMGMNLGASFWLIGMFSPKVYYCVVGRANDATLQQTESSLQNMRADQFKRTKPPHKQMVSDLPSELDKDSEKDQQTNIQLASLKNENAILHHKIRDFQSRLVQVSKPLAVYSRRRLIRQPVAQPSHTDLSIVYRQLQQLANLNSHKHIANTRLLTDRQNYVDSFYSRTPSSIVKGPLVAHSERDELAVNEHSPLEEEPASHERLTAIRVSPNSPCPSPPIDSPHTHAQAQADFEASLIAHQTSHAAQENTNQSLTPSLNVHTSQSQSDSQSVSHSTSNAKSNSDSTSQSNSKSNSSSSSNSNSATTHLSVTTSPHAPTSSPHSSLHSRLAEQARKKERERERERLNEIEMQSQLHMHLRDETQSTHPHSQAHPPPPAAMRKPVSQSSVDRDQQLNGESIEDPSAFGIDDRNDETGDLATRLESASFSKPIDVNVDVDIDSQLHVPSHLHSNSNSGSLSVSASRLNPRLIHLLSAEQPSAASSATSSARNSQSRS